MTIKDKARKRQKLDWEEVRNNENVVAVSISVRKGENMFIIMISKDKDVVMNFGSDHWIPFLKLFEMEDEIDHQNYQEFINNPKNKKNYEETKEVIENSEDFTEIADKFYNDFRTDRGNKIRLDIVEGQSYEETQRLKEAFGGNDE